VEALVRRQLSRPRPTTAVAHCRPGPERCWRCMQYGQQCRMGLATDGPGQFVDIVNVVLRQLQEFSYDVLT